jgi:hypothetical protein
LAQEYSALKKRYYSPSPHGFESVIATRLKAIREILGR